MKWPGATSLLCMTACLLVAGTSGPDARPLTAILGALDAEVALLSDRMVDRQERLIEGIRFAEGRLEGREVVLARTGVGKVNAAMIATLLIEHFRPSEVIFTGVAGGINPELKTGDIVIATKTAHHDLGSFGPDGFKNWGVRNPVNRKRNPVHFPADDRLVALAVTSADSVDLERIVTGGVDRKPRIVKGTVVTGDMFVESSAKKTELRQRLQADAVEMEGAAVAQICWQQGVPCLVIRSLSDLADEAADTDFEMFLKTAAQNSAALVVELVKQLRQ